MSIEDVRSRLAAIEGRVTELLGGLAALTPADTQPANFADLLAKVGTKPTLAEAQALALAANAPPGATRTTPLGGKGGLIAPATPAGVASAKNLGTPVTGWSTQQRIDYWRPHARQIAIEEGVDPALFTALLIQESGGNEHIPSPAGAIGLTQLMPGTALGLGVNPHDNLQNLRGGARYLKQQLNTFGSVDLALAAYNAGPGTVQATGATGPLRVPAIGETQSYVPSVQALWAAERGRADHNPRTVGGTP